LFVVFAGRMTSISASEGTGQSRIQLWSDGLMFFQQAPLFGIGMNYYPYVSRHVAHNSYIHCYAELGILGGTLFLGAFYFALLGLYRARPEPTVEERPDADPELGRLHAFLMAMLVSYAVGIFFLSRSYVVPTYLMLGLSVVYQRLRTQGAPPVTPAWCKMAVPRLAGISLCFLIASYTFVRLFVNWH
jgi:O-antigen ligase